MANRTRVCDILNELLAAEELDLLPRLTECTTFVSSADVSEFEAVRRMADEQKANTARLAQVLIDLDEEPRPCVRDITSANFHYMELPALLPRVQAREEQIAAQYEAALAQLNECKEVARVVGEIGARHRVYAEFLRRLTGDITLPPG